MPGFLSLITGSSNEAAQINQVDRLHGLATRADRR
jgi:hypothetical protein